MPYINEPLFLARPEGFLRRKKIEEWNEPTQCEHQLDAGTVVMLPRNEYRNFPTRQLIHNSYVIIFGTYETLDCYLAVSEG